MEEKELVKDIRWDLSEGKSRAQITRKLQNKGLKLEYIDSLISRANRPKRFFIGFLLSVLIFSSMWFGVYAMFFYESTEEFEYSPSWKNESSEVLEVTPELISFFFSEIGATELRRSPLTFKKPIINLEVSDKHFYTVIDSSVETFEGRSDGADLSFILGEGVLEEIFSSEEFSQSIKTLFSEGKITLEKISSDQELFLKGYLGLYSQFT